MPNKTSLSPLYTRYLTAEEKRSLRAVPMKDVSSEINLLRVLTAIFLKFQQSAPQDLASRIQTLRTCTLLCKQLAVLVQSHEEEHSPFADLDDAIHQAIAEIAPLWEKV